jgi:hypothetical protein
MRNLIIVPLTPRPEHLAGLDAAASTFPFPASAAASPDRITPLYVVTRCGLFAAGAVVGALWMVFA